MPKAGKDKGKSRDTLYLRAIAAVLRQLRARLGSQTAVAGLARKAGLRLTQSTIGAWERGDQEIKAARLFAYLAVLGCAPARFGEMVEEEKDRLAAAPRFEEVLGRVRREVEGSPRASLVRRRISSFAARRDG